MVNKSSIESVGLWRFALVDSPSGVLEDVSLGLGECVREAGTCTFALKWEGRRHSVAYGVSTSKLTTNINFPVDNKEYCQGLSKLTLRCQCSMYHNKADSKPEGYPVLLNVP